MSLNIGSVLERNTKDFFASSVGEEMVVMNMATGNYIGLNPVASHIWTLLEKPVEVAALISQLMEVYEINHETCETQTLEYLNNMHQQGMVVLNG